MTFLELMGCPWVPIVTAEDCVVGYRLSCRCQVLSLLSWATVVTLPLFRLGKSATIPEWAKIGSEALHDGWGCGM